jgi:hypothetical protein
MFRLGMVKGKISAQPEVGTFRFTVRDPNFKV